MQPANLLEYQKAVWAAMDAYMAGLTAEDLDRKMKLSPRELTVAELLMLAANQSAQRFSLTAAAGRASLLHVIASLLANRACA